MNFIDKPDLKIKDLFNSKDEKQNIEKIYKEIDKEVKVLAIDRKKDEEFKRLKSGLSSHESNFSKFVQSIPKIIKKIKDKESKRVRRQASKAQEGEIVRRVRRYSREKITEEEKNERDAFIGVLGQIKNSDINNKRAVWEFYKSYLLALREEEDLFNQLKRVDDESSDKELKRKKRNIDSVEKNLIYLSQKGWWDKQASLSGEGKWDSKDNTLLSEQLINSLKNEWESIQKEIDEMGEGVSLFQCGMLSMPLSFAIGTNQCIEDIKKLKNNQNVLTRALEFKILIQLLQDMGINKKHKFDIVYEDKK